MKQNFTQEDILKMIEMIDIELRNIEEEHKQANLDDLHLRKDIVEEHIKNKDGYVVIYPDVDSNKVLFAKFETKQDAEDFRKTEPLWSILKPIVDEELDQVICDYEYKCEYFNKTRQTLRETRRIFCNKLDDDHIKLVSMYR